MTKNNQANLLITGSNGFVGSHLVPELEHHFRLQKLVYNTTDPTEISCDLSLDPVPEIIRSVDRIDQVIHMAALTPKDKDDNVLTKAANFYKINLQGTFNLLKIVADKKIDHFVYVSTLDVYGLRHKEISEDSSVNPETYYAASKLAAEDACAIFCRDHQIPFAILRLGHIYGPGEGLYKKVIPIFLARALVGEPLLIYGQGMALRNFIYVGDVARAINLVATKKITGVYNIVGSESISILGLAKLTKQLTGSQSKIEFPDRQFPETNFIFDNSKLKSLGFDYSMSLEDGLKEEINFLKQK